MFVYYTELSILLFSCLTAIKTIFKYCEKFTRVMVKYIFGFIKYSGEILDKLISKSFLWDRGSHCGTLKPLEDH